jgi:vacuolar protein sorting-associated protein 29
MVLVLVVGDLHIPQRAADIPEQFKKLFAPGRINAIFLTGNVCCREVFDYFREVCSNIYAVKGEFDDYAKDIPETQVVEIEDLKFGIIHGHQVVPWGDKESLGQWQRKLGVDVLVSGHTHNQKTFELDGKLFMNPGSITGAFSPFDCDVPPTFVLMEVVERKVTSFIYGMEGGEMKIKKKEFTRAL